jgi:putative transposase
MQLRKIIKTRGHLPNDDAATRLLWLALRNVMSKSIRSTRGWKIAINRFAILSRPKLVTARGRTRRVGFKQEISK